MEVLMTFGNSDPESYIPVKWLPSISQERMTGRAMTFSGERRVTFREKSLFPFYGVPCGSAHFPSSVNNKHTLVQQSWQKRAPKAPEDTMMGQAKGWWRETERHQSFPCHFNDKNILALGKMKEEGLCLYGGQAMKFSYFDLMLTGSTWFLFLERLHIYFANCTTALLSFIPSWDATGILLWLPLVLKEDVSGRHFPNGTSCFSSTWRHWHRLMWAVRDRRKGLLGATFILIFLWYLICFPFTSKKMWDHMQDGGKTITDRKGKYPSPIFADTAVGKYYPKYCLKLKHVWGTESELLCPRSFLEGLTQTGPSIFSVKNKNEQLHYFHFLSLIRTTNCF